MPERFDLIVIGSGEAGGTPAVECRQAGWSVAVIDDQPFGGTCALRGCDPKKVLVGAADITERHSRMRSFGVTGDASIDWPALMAFKRTFTDPVPPRRESAFSKLGIVCLHGEARFVAPDRLMIADRELHFKRVVVAAGAAPRPLGIRGEAFATSSTQFLELERLPRRIALIGAGYISLEFASLTRAAGAETTVFGRGTPLRAFDSTLVDGLLEALRARGIAIQLNTEVTAVEPLENGRGFRVDVTRNGSRETHEVDLVVHGAGRIPNAPRLNVGAGNVRLDERGAIAVNEFLQSVTNERVYAAGDVTRPAGKLPLTPVAAHEGAIVASNLLRGNQKRADYRGAPSVVFTTPRLAAVGLTETAARENGLDVRVKCEDTTGWYSHRRTRERVGMYKTIVENGTDRIVGAHLLGESADEVINVFALAMRFDVGARDLRHMTYAYPTGASDIPYMV